ncbi:ABC transporter substrate-binding protein [Paenibacillus swuensis]|uniref:ABC transporter substrate-binding protein n=1 Tax=Paenibacillus swuensis TaxID=1178515 RepID=A0A172TKF6_9BACL|nr:extracellular solute-binding protein [Paenibacillus swuensis]ANE47404.1 ABC transporter substrate-binding protein [Paenibacillus swuensis]
MNLNKRLRKSIVIGLALSLVLPVLAACNNNSEAKDTEQRVLRIATMWGGGDDTWLRQQFTEIFEYTNPNIEIEFVPAIEQSMYGYDQPKQGEKQPDPVEEMKKKLTGPNPPDVVMLDYGQLSTFIDDNLLTPLDPMLTDDKFDTSVLVPAVYEGLKKLGDDKLYALAPTFSSSALFYNKAMFQEAGVELPKDGLTWDDVFNLARQLKSGEGENAKYGFSFNSYSGSDPFYDTIQYSAPLQLSMFDDKGEKMTVDTDKWEQVWSTIVGINNEKLLPVMDDPSKPRPMEKAGSYNPFQGDNFLSGKVGMTIAHYGYINQLIDANKNAEKVEGFKPVDWDVVTVPVHPEAPGIGGNIWMNGVMGINAKAQNLKDAWAFIKFINSEDWARLKSRSSYDLVSHVKYNKPKEGLQYNIEAFYKLSPIPNQDNMSKLYQKMPNLHRVQELGRTKFQEVLKGKKKVREALKEWDTEGNALLAEIKKNPNGPMEGGVGGEVYTK